MLSGHLVWISTRAMTDDRRIAERRTLIRRALEAAGKREPAADSTPGQALVPVASPEPDGDQPIQPKPRRGGAAGFAAQILGQGGQKRGLRGGPETLERARSTYLGAEWSGPADRRPRPGRITKTEI
jgi:hypothetical protein